MYAIASTILLIGTPLMQEAFRLQGPLWRAELASRAGSYESVALMELFKGAIGLFKNPSSHRRVDFSAPTEAAEIIVQCPQPRLQPAVISFDRVVRILLCDMAGGGQQLIEHSRVGGSPVGAHLSWACAVLERAGEEPASGG